MPAFSSSAPGKIILFGEHSVVYGKPALAIPVNKVRARVYVDAIPNSLTGFVSIAAPDIGIDSNLEDLPGDHPLVQTLHLFKTHFGLSHLPSMRIRITSSIPVAAGLGSGAAVSVAMFRALSGFIGQPLDDATISSLAFEMEKTHHGTPSGIDNTVIAYNMPVFFIKNTPATLLNICHTFHLVIADSGRSSQTKDVLDWVRQKRELDTSWYDQKFETMGRIAESARECIETGYIPELGDLMNKNHALLKDIGVSDPLLDHLVEVATENGAGGAKLSGAGWGGNMIALVEAGNSERIASLLEKAGAVHTIQTSVSQQESPPK